MDELPTTHHNMGRLGEGVETGRRGVHVGGGGGDAMLGCPVSKLRWPFAQGTLVRLGVSLLRRLLIFSLHLLLSLAPVPWGMSYAEIVLATENTKSSR